MPKKVMKINKKIKMKLQIISMHAMFVQLKQLGEFLDMKLLNMSLLFKV